MSRHRRGRVTVQHQPTGAAKVMYRMVGVIHAVIGSIFVLLSLTMIIPGAGLFGIPFLLVGGFFAVNGVLIALGRNGFAHRVGYDIETDVEQETIVGILDDVDRMEEEGVSSSAPDHDHISSIGPDPKARLERLESLKSAGLITSEEYKEKRQEILKDL